MRHVTDATPASLGFAMPGEWAPHEATWMCWPFDDEEWKGHLEGARREHAILVTTLAGHEPIHLLCHDETVEADARSRLGSADVRYHRIPLDDVWFRDNGPTWLVRQDGVASFVNWRFNAWGGKYDSGLDDRVPETLASLLAIDHFDVDVVMEGGSIDCNGEGVVLTTRQCLLTPTRNPDHGEAELERILRDYLGQHRVIWLDEGLEGDHTDGHVDTIARFVDARTITCCLCEDPSDANFETTHRNLEVLRDAVDAQGHPFRVVPVPQPKSRAEDAGERLPLTYVNFYIANGIVVVPQYGDPHDRLALEILEPLFPGRRVVGLPSAELITSGGSFHCLTQQQPAGSPWRHP